MANAAAPTPAGAAPVPVLLSHTVAVTIMIGVIVLFGDHLTRHRCFMAQFQSDQTFRFHCIRNLYACWHALRVWDLKNWAALYQQEQIDGAGTFPYYTNQLGLLLRKTPTKEAQNDRL